MNFIPTQIPGVIIVEPDVFRDDRGYFFESYHTEKYAAGGIDQPFVQDNQSHSIRGTLRGLHAQRLHPQGKLVRALSGEIFDVAVDIRPGSATFGRWVGAILSAENRHQLWVPAGFAHGFAVLSDTADVLYKCTTLYRRDDEIAILWNDPEIGIEWPLLSPPLLSPKDREAPRLAAIRDQLIG
jgi:dTDP-4-dehydrorhamnose 3,5-epimerase